MSPFEGRLYIVMPNRNDLLARLRSVYTSDAVERHFFPTILEAAGKAQTGIGVTLLLSIAYSEFEDQYRDLPGTPISLKLMLSSYIDAIIDAPAVRELAQETLKYFG
jgi:hypothetical protein